MFDGDCLGLNALVTLPVCKLHRTMVVHSGGRVSAVSALFLRLPAYDLQWLFILEGAPSVMLGLVMLLLLPSRPLNGRAWMLSDKEQQMLEQEVRHCGQSVRMSGDAADWSHVDGTNHDLCLSVTRHCAGILVSNTRFNCMHKHERAL